MVIPAGETSIIANSNGKCSSLYKIDVFKNLDRASFLLFCGVARASAEHTILGTIGCSHNAMGIIVQCEITPESSLTVKIRNASRYDIEVIAESV